VQEYVDLNVNYTAKIFLRGQIIGLLPNFLKPCVSHLTLHRMSLIWAAIRRILGPLLATRKSSLRDALKYLGPLLDERLEKERENGREWPNRPVRVSGREYIRRLRITADGYPERLHLVAARHRAGRRGAHSSGARAAHPRDKHGRYPHLLKCKPVFYPHSAWTE
jgi:hypothetical protein